MESGVHRPISPSGLPTPMYGDGPPAHDRNHYSGGSSGWWKADLAAMRRFVGLDDTAYFEARESTLVAYTQAMCYHCNLIDSCPRQRLA